VICQRQIGGSVKDCECMLPNQGGWLECPPEARGILVAYGVGTPATAGDEFRSVLQHEVYSGDICQECGSPDMVRTGTCLTCQRCGSSNGGCS
jgi:hypothetical protein